MKLQGLLSHVRRWFRGLPAVPDQSGLERSQDLPLPRIGGKTSDDDSWFGRVTAAEQREWQELLATADLGPRLCDEPDRRREQRHHRRAAARRAAR
jgi:hypothetical protein